MPIRNLNWSRGTAIIGESLRNGYFPRGILSIGDAYALSAGYCEAYYRKAQQVRTPITRDSRNAFEELDAIVAPVSPFPAFKIGAKIENPLAMYLSDVYTLTGDLSGVPCMSVPCGESAEGLPIGLQIITKHFDEATMFRIAYNYEHSVTR